MGNLEQELDLIDLVDLEGDGPEDLRPEHDVLEDTVHDTVVEVVDELVFDAVDEGTPYEQEPPQERYSQFVAQMTDVALLFGADPGGIGRLRAMLGQARLDGVARDPGAMAWQGVIRGENNEYSACGSATLDEWAAGIVGRVVGDARSDAIRKELRRRGVVAFGFLAETA